MKWIRLLLAGWSTLVAALFLASSSGDVTVQLFGSSKHAQYLVKGLVMSGLVVPIILYLYQHLYRMTGIKPKTPIYSWKRGYHFFTGVLLAIALGAMGFIIASSQGWIVIEKWHAPDQWFAALLINVVFAVLYEALPEELGLRGFLYDVLRHRFPAWLSVLLQTLLFVAVTTAVALIQAFVGLAPGVSLDISYIVIIFCFGVGLQLLRLWTGSLWASIGYHLTYLEIMRFAILPHVYGVPPIITYQDSVHGLSFLFAIAMMQIGGIIVSLVILGTKRLIQKRKMIRTDTHS
ncbi:CPBP family intramembrane metalloprotease [Paenibacillus sp. MER TA 81-3]|uniref:CPBP family intramembrane glutamic endopeptidase n=1 Tax=Paenibacillus sp. MER TA 81-3 TaxID=2939573 RepID=UPI00203EF3D8|nr:CPBP family intramembrane glutamic endopeptidase [Paenibacillus sp. MER TA 81-3]MCM3340689.1 CPBP family intramembrane metalloprotease [Paenibacillus sp. MER TA 81-3]